MEWFDPRAYGRAPSSRRGKLLVLGASLAILAGLTVMVTGGFAQSSDGSPGASAAAKKKRTFVRACVQRHDVKHSQGDLNVFEERVREGPGPLRLALWPVKRKAGKQGAPGPAGTAGCPRRSRRDPMARRRRRLRTAWRGCGGTKRPAVARSAGRLLGRPRLGRLDRRGRPVPLLVLGCPGAVQGLARSRRHLQPNGHRGLLPEDR